MSERPGREGEWRRMDYMQRWLERLQSLEQQIPSYSQYEFLGRQKEEELDAEEAVDDGEEEAVALLAELLPSAEELEEAALLEDEMGVDEEDEAIAEEDEDGGEGEDDEEMTEDAIEEEAAMLLEVGGGMDDAGGGGVYVTGDVQADVVRDSSNASTTGVGKSSLMLTFSRFVVEPLVPSVQSVRLLGPFP